MRNEIQFANHATFGSLEEGDEWVGRRPWAAAPRRIAELEQFLTERARGGPQGEAAIYMQQRATHKKI